jgi:putative nucleotidyltransferase with HDIG domain
MVNTVVSKTGSLKMGVVAFTFVLVSLVQFVIPTEPDANLKLQMALRTLIFLPAVLAAAWFGLRGAFYISAAITVLFSAHDFLNSSGFDRFSGLGLLAVLWLVALIAGYLFDRERTLLRRTARVNEETVLGLVSALDMRERSTGLHSQRVREYTLLLAERYGTPESRTEAIGVGALLHDIGKIGVSDRTLLKPSALSEAEWAEMRRHPATGYQLLQRVGFMPESADIVHAHHEHYDGSGYPRGLQREEIPLGARLFIVADVFDAVTTKRPYHVPMSYDEAMTEIRKNSGTQFDPEVVRAFETIAPAELEAIRMKYTDG